jgi:folate-binding protein YgfZ
VLAHALVAAASDRLLVYSLASDLPALVPHLDRYIIRDDVALADTSAEPGPWLVAGDWPGESDLAIETNAFGPMLTLVDGSSARRRSLAEGLSQLHQTDPAEFASLRIAAGWPMHGIDFDDRALPQELSRTDQAISFAKGCYLGQETVARLDALGHVNKQLVRLSLAGDATVHAPAALTMGDRPAGQLTSLAVDPAGDAQVALATVRSEFAGAGCQLDCGGAACVVL